MTQTYYSTVFDHGDYAIYHWSGLRRCKSDEDDNRLAQDIGELRGLLESDQSAISHNISGASNFPNAQ